MKNAISIALAVIVGYAVLTLVRGGGAPAATPTVFSEGTSLEQAIASSKESGKPVYAVVTASWCGPCQKLKKETLTDSAVASWIGQNTIPVFIDSDASPADASRLGVSSIPASFVLRGDEVVASRVGYAKAKDYLKFLQDAVPEG